MTFGHTEQSGHIPTRQTAPIENGFEKLVRFWWQGIEPDLLFGPHENAGAQRIGLHEGAHEAHLIEAGFQEELRELGQRAFAECAAPVQIAASVGITGRQMSLVGGFMARQTACNRPEGNRYRDCAAAWHGS